MPTSEQFAESDRDAHNEALRETGFWGRMAAGSIVLSKNTGRILLCHRSENVLEPGTWGTWGGACDHSETPLQAAIRELLEECQYRKTLDMIPLAVFRHESGFSYHNHLAVVDDEFVPVLNWEAQGFTWVDLDNFPAPLHPGLQYLLDHSGNQLRSLIQELCSPDRHAEAGLIVTPLEEFLVGPGRTFESLDIDECFGKTFDHVRSEALDDDAAAFDTVGSDKLSLRSEDAPGYWIEEVVAGVALYGPDGNVVGGYIGCDLALQDEHRGKGLGAEIVRAYYTLHGSLPTWELDAAAYTPAGLRSHEAAWRLVRQDLLTKPSEDASIRRLRP